MWKGGRDVGREPVGPTPRHTLPISSLLEEGVRAGLWEPTSALCDAGLHVMESQVTTNRVDIAPTSIQYLTYR